LQAYTFFDLSNFVVSDFSAIRFSAF